MDYIRIYCSECPFIIYPGSLLIDYNEDEIKNIVYSNYVTHFNYCTHRSNEMINLFVEINKNIWRSKPLQYSAIVNYNYSNFYKIFTIKENIKTLELIFILKDSFKKDKEVSVEKFMNIITKGTIIDFDYNYIIPKFKAILLEHNPSFILKEIKKIGCDETDYFTIYMIDSPNYTKPANKD